MGEIKELAFYNNYHSGDIIISRNWVKWLVDHFKVPATYYHLNSGRLMLDCPIDIVKAQVNDDGEVLKINGDKAIFNTWYAAGRSKYFKTCSIQSLDTMFRTECKEKLELELPPIEKFIPSFNWDHFDTGLIEEYVATLKNSYKKIVMICNNDTLSGQSQNFDMTPIILTLAEKFPDYCFFYTNWINLKALPKNVEAAYAFTEPKENLAEMGYLASLCDFVIGRSSGPFTAAINKDSLANGTQFISICNPDPQLFDWGLSDLNYTNFHHINCHQNIEEIFNQISIYLR